MTCVICKQAETEPGRATVVLERDGATLVFRDVPAHVCPNCGEEYVDEDVAATLLADAEHAVKTGVRVELREYMAA